MSAGTSERRILVTGGSGQVGDALVRSLAACGVVTAPPRAELDLASADSMRACIRKIEPQWIVNAGAYTAVDRAESEPELAYAINSEAVHVIGEEARRSGAAVIHFSTDYVFDGEAARPYIETDQTGPLGVYGGSKLAGEKALMASGAPSFIFRTSWVYGATGKNFLRTILKLARERESLRIVGDQHGAPTWSRDLAALAAHVITRCYTENADPRHAAGRVGAIYHATGAGETTWAGFAAEAIRLSQEREPSTTWAAVESITTAEYPTPATRPANSRLDCTKLAEALGWQMMDWKVSLAKVLAELDASSS